MPVSISLFYDSRDTKSGLSPHKLDMFLVDQNRYDDSALNMISNSTDSICALNNYNFGNIKIKAIDFYRWAWIFTSNDELLKSILGYFSEIRNVESKHTSFLFQVLKAASIYHYDETSNRTVVTGMKDLDLPVRFTVALSGSDALSNNTIINFIHRSSNYDIIFRVTDQLKAEVLDVKHRIMQGLKDQSSSHLVKEIERADFWDNILLADSGDDIEFYGRYAIIQCAQSYMPSLLIGKSNDNNSYVQALVSYIKDEYGIKLDGVTTDWSTEYDKLVLKVKDFICDYQDGIISEDEILFNVSDMADVDTLKEEYNIWNALKKEKTLIMSNRISEVDLATWRGFLNNKYHGRCQLCGNRTVSGSQNAFFWTYRIAKEKENNLANMYSNILCVCPSCHGELSHGFRGKNLLSIKSKVDEYLEQLSACLEEELDDLEDMESTISSFADYDNEYEGYHAPIVCDVIVNGIERKMVFSWEHFIRIAFLLSNVSEAETKRGIE